jgi:hypothetical protein
MIIQNRKVYTIHALCVILIGAGMIFSLHGWQVGALGE